LIRGNVASHVDTVAEQLRIEAKANVEQDARFRSA
jgi:hypothetical protein